MVVLSILGLEFGLRIRLAVSNMKQLGTPKKRERDRKEGHFSNLSWPPFFLSPVVTPHPDISLSLYPLLSLPPPLISHHTQPPSPPKAPIFISTQLRNPKISPPQHQMSPVLQILGKNWRFCHNFGGLDGKFRASNTHLNMALKSSL